jgi:hypothetical protein
VADGQRLGMKLKLQCNTTFATSAKLATSEATGICRFARVWPA